jgi:hypothetical protein
MREISAVTRIPGSDVDLTRLATSAASPRSARAFGRGLIAIIVGALVLNGSSLGIYFISDDYILVDRAITLGAGSITARMDLPWHYWRPLSRELHFLVIQSLAGPSPFAYHAVSLVLWLGVLVAFAFLVRRFWDDATAIVATCGVACMSGFASALGWAAGAQNLWFLLFSILFLHAFAARKVVAGALFMALALLSKELAVVLVPLAFAWAMCMQRDPPLRALARLWPELCLVGLWAGLNPTLSAARATSIEHAAEPIGLLRGLLAWANLHAVPSPEQGWTRPIVLGVATAACFALAILAVRSASGVPADSPKGSRSRGRMIVLCCIWAGLGLLPYLLPSLSWQAYYGLLGGLGAWIGIGMLLRGTPWLAAGLIVVVAVLGVAQVETPEWAWGAPSFQRRNAKLLEYMHRDMLAAQPRIAEHARLYFSRRRSSTSSASFIPPRRNSRSISHTASSARVIPLMPLPGARALTPSRVSDADGTNACGGVEGAAAPGQPGGFLGAR